MGNGREWLELWAGRPASTGRLVERLSGKEEALVKEGFLEEEEKVDTGREGGTRSKEKKRRGSSLQGNILLEAGEGNVSSRLSYMSAIVGTLAAAAQREASWLGR